MATLVYRYGLFAPTHNAKLVSDQIWEAHQYRNGLIEIERDFRDKMRAIYGEKDARLGLTDLVNAHKSLLDKKEEIHAEINAIRAKARKKVETPEQEEKLEELYKEISKAYAVLNSARGSNPFTEDEKAKRKVVTDEAIARRNKLYGESAAFWGSCLWQKRAMEASQKMPLWRRGVPNNPKFKQWDGEGAVAVQIQKPAQKPVEDTLANPKNSVQLHLEPVDPTWTKERGIKRRGELWLRVGSDGKDPIWAKWPMLWHRPLPTGFKISWAAVLREYVADRVVWTLHLTLEPIEDAVQDSNRKKCGSGAVAVDIGWRKMDNTLRVAYFRDDDVNMTKDELRLDSAVLSELSRVYSLAGTRDDNRNAMQDALYAWVKTKTLPAWMLKLDVPHIYTWESQARFADLLRTWKNSRWEGDEEGFSILEDWHDGVLRDGRRKGGDRHLWQWEEHQRKTALGRRKHQYRNFANKMAERYAVLIIEDFDLRKMQRHKKTKDTTPEIKAQRLQQRHAACSELRLCLVNAFLSRGGHVVKVDPAYTTIPCHVCGFEGKWDAAISVDHTCEGCGATWDQDDNATVNIMQLFKQDKLVSRVGPDTPKKASAVRGRRKKKVEEPAQP
jgi:hypothetical protein